MPIPKKIHYIWLSTQAKDSVYKRCIQSWQKILTGYKFILWDSSTILKSAFYNKMLKQQKWVFASDYLRLYLLYHHGGIYLDMDVEVLKRFDDLLSHECFLGREDADYLAGHILGAKKGHPFVKKCLDYYDNSFRLKISPPPTLPRILTDVASRYGLEKRDNEQILTEGIIVFPSGFVSPLHYLNRTVNNPQSAIKKESYCIHFWSHGWSWDDSRHILTHLKNQPWLFMNWKDWKRLLNKIKTHIFA